MITVYNGSEVWIKMKKLFSGFSLHNGPDLSEYEKARFLLTRLFCISTPPVLLCVTFLHWFYSNSRIALLSLILTGISLVALLLFLFRSYQAAVYVFLVIPVFAQASILLYKEDLVRPYLPEIAFYVILVVGIITLVMSSLLSMKKRVHAVYALLTLGIASAAFFNLRTDLNTSTLLAFYMLEIVLIAFSFYIVVINKKVNALVLEKNRMLEEKNDMDASITHELRNLLTGMVGMNELLKNTRLDQQQKKYMNILETGTLSVIKIVNDLHEYTRFENHALSINKQRFELVTFLEMIATSLHAQAQNKGIGFEMKIYPGLDSIHSDQLRLQQIILNLAGNSIKFTQAGTVSLSVSRDGDRIDFEIRDTGPGMSAQKVSHIFEKYNQLDKSIQQHYGGSGLGMYISRLIIEALGGDISVESEEGQGTTFRFWIPVVDA